VIAPGGDDAPPCRRSAQRVADRESAEKATGRSVFVDSVFDSRENRLMQGFERMDREFIDAELLAVTWSRRAACSRYRPRTRPRMPLIIVSPYEGPGYTDTTPTTFARILAYTGHNFGLHALGANDAKAYDLSNAFDYSQTPLKPVRMTTRPLPAWAIHMKLTKPCSATRSDPAHWRPSGPIRPSLLPMAGPTRGHDRA
jgi:hypothetical protein